VKYHENYFNTLKKSFIPVMAKMNSASPSLPKSAYYNDKH